MSVGPRERALLEGLPIEVHVTEAGGARLRWIEAGKSARSVVLLHGRSLSAALWAPYLTELATDFRVIAIDLPGFGLSTAPSQRPTTPEQGLEFFAGPVRALLQQLHLGRAAIVGHSLGALIAIDLARTLGPAVGPLGLIGAMGLGPKMRLPARLFFKAGPERLSAWLGGKTLGRIKGVDVDLPLEQATFELLAAARRPEANRAFNALFPIFGSAWNVLSQLPQISNPTLLVHGARDEVLPPQNSRDAAKRFPHAELLELDAGHAPHLEQFDRVLPRLRSLFERV